MSDSRPLPAEPVPAAPERGDFCAPEPLSPPLALADAWASGALALIVGGSHATGEAAWAMVEGRRLCLSDLDVYAVVPDRAAQRAAGERARGGRTGLRARLLGWGLAAPLEVAFLTPPDLERLPARPGTIELRRHGRVVKGGPAWRDRIPACGPRDVSTEEVRLLHENRAFELLLAWPALAAAPVLDRLQGRHAVLKCALDVARVEALRAGEYPDGAGALAAWARAPRPGAAGATPAFDGVLDAALAWRAGKVEALETAAARSEWRATVGAWVGVWEVLAGAGVGAVLAAARRARLRRRIRLALEGGARGGQGPGLAGRLTCALRGTPQHRVNAAAALLHGAAAAAPGAGEPILADPESAVLARLGFARAARSGWPAAARIVCETWDRWVLDGQRTAEPA